MGKVDLIFWLQSVDACARCVVRVRVFLNEPMLG